MRCLAASAAVVREREAQKTLMELDVFLTSTVFGLLAFHEIVKFTGQSVLPRRHAEAK
jgi:hypothetical protein